MKEAIVALILYLFNLDGTGQSIEWSGNYINGGMVISHHTSDKVQADTLFVKGRNTTNQTVHFEKNLFKIKKPEVYVHYPEIVKPYEIFEVAIGVRHRIESRQLIEFVTEQWIFYQEEGEVSTFMLQYFLVDSDVVRVKRGDGSIELQGFDRTDIPVRLILNGNGEPILMEQYHPLSNEAIGLTIALHSNNTWVTDVSKRVTGLDVSWVDIDSIIPAPATNPGKMKYSFFSGPVNDVRSISYWKDGIESTFTPFKRQPEGLYFMQWKENQDSIVIESRDYRQTLRYPVFDTYLDRVSVLMYKGNHAMMYCGGTNFPYRPIQGAFAIIFSDDQQIWKNWGNRSDVPEYLRKKYGDKLIVEGEMIILQKKYEKDWSIILKSLIDEPFIVNLSQRLIGPASGRDTHAQNLVYIDFHKSMNKEEWEKMLVPYGLTFLDFRGFLPKQIRAISKEGVIDSAFFNAMNELAVSKQIKRIHIQYF